MNILCFGDSNTYGYKPDGTGRFDTDTRWTSLLQKKLGADHRVIEEGLCGRTTVFQDDLREGRRGLDLIGRRKYPVQNMSIEDQEKIETRKKAAGAALVFMTLGAIGFVINIMRIYI